MTIAFTGESRSAIALRKDYPSASLLRYSENHRGEQRIS